MTTAFAAAAPLSAARPSTAAFTPSVSRPLPCPAAATVTMRSRRDLKKEKSLRNLEFARAHRKRVIKRYNRRAAQEAISNEDNEYLSSIYGTMRFGSDNNDNRRH